MENLMLQSIWIPALGGIICLILVQLRGKGAEIFMDVVRRIISLLVSGYVLYAGIMLFLSSGARVSLGALKLGSLSTPIVLHAKPFGSLLVALVGLFGVIHIIYSWHYRTGKPHNSWYYGLSLLTLATANAVFLAADMFTIFVSWEISTLCLFGLVALGDRPKTQLAAGKTLAIIGLAETGMLFFVIYAWITNGTLLLDALHFGVPAGGIKLLLYFFLVVSAIAKMGVMPFHSWVPSASEGAPLSIMGFLPASVDKLLGVYLLFLASMQIFSMSHTIKLVLMIVGIVSAIFAVFMAMLQNDLRRLLAYCAISQAGYVVLGIGTGSPIGILGALFHMLNHAIYKNSLFLCAGAIEKKAGTTDLMKLGGLVRKMPWLFFANLVAALAVAGVPPLNGFISKWMIYQACVIVNVPIMFVFIVFGSALTLATFVKALHSIYFGSLPNELKDVKAPNFWLTAPPFILSLICIFFGLVPGFPLGRLLSYSTGISVGVIKPFQLSFGDSLWQPLFAFGLMFLGVVVAVLYYASGRAFKTRRDAAYVGGVRPGTIGGYEIFTYEKLRVPGTGFYNNIKEVAVFKAVLPDAERGVFDPYSYISKIGYAIIVKPLRLLHNGILSTYLSWAIIGLVIIGLVLIRAY